MLTYLLLMAIIFLGLYIGLCIGYVAEEELKPGRKYFEILRHLLFLAALAVFFIKNPSIIFFIFTALLIIIFSFSRHRETLYYYALAVILFISWRFNGFTLLAPLTFLYGFPVGSIYLHTHFKGKKKKKQILLGMFRQYAGFLIVGVVLGILGLFI